MCCSSCVFGYMKNVLWNTNEMVIWSYIQNFELFIYSKSSADANFVGPNT